MLRLIAVTLVPFALAAGTAFGAKGGPAPGVQIGWDGAVDRSTGTRYVALPGAGSTTVAVIRTSDGRVLRHTTIRGEFGVPLVAFDGTAEGVSSDGETLVLADLAAGPKRTTFAVLRTRSLRLASQFTLRGRWAYDALSPDGRTLYALQYDGAGRDPRYSVRSVSLVTGKPFGAAIVDRRVPDEEMHGSPWSRVWSGNSARAYTFYAQPNGSAFVHALDTARRVAYCIDLPWQSSLQALTNVRLSLDSGGRRLVLSTPRSGRLAVVDTTTFKVTSFRKP